MVKSSYCVYRVTLLIVFVVLSNMAKPQDPYFSQFYMNPVYLNPAYTGNLKIPRVGIQYRNQWPAMNKAYVTHFLSFDTYSPKLESGLGVMVYQDLQGNGAYSSSSVKAIWSKEIKLNKKWAMSGSLTAGAQLNSINFNRLLFSDGINRSTGEEQPSNEISPDASFKLFPDFGTGLLINNGNYFIGITADHLLEPNQAFYNYEISELKRKITTHFEFSFPWYRHGHYKKFFSISPNAIAFFQGSEVNITYGAYLNRKTLITGVWNRLTTRGSSDMIIMAGYMGKQLKTAISYDFNLWGVGLKSLGAFEISFAYLLKDPSEKSKYPFYAIPYDWDL